MSKNLNGEEEYVRIDYEDASKTKTQYEDVADVSHLYDDDELKFDWTEVVLYGNKETQNTVLDPFDGNPKVSKIGLQNLCITDFIGYLRV